MLSTLCPVLPTFPPTLPVAHSCSTTTIPTGLAALVGSAGSDDETAAPPHLVAELQKKGSW